MSDKIKIIHTDCDPTVADDKSLPYNAYLVEYLQDGMTKFDIVIGNKMADIFDHYYDNYRRDFRNMTQTKGQVNPKLWTSDKKTEKKKK